jgi:hypothetical protein
VAFRKKTRAIKMEVLVLATTSTSDLEYLISIIKKSNVQLIQCQDPKEV